MPYTHMILYCDILRDIASYSYLKYTLSFRPILNMSTPFLLPLMWYDIFYDYLCIFLKTSISNLLKLQQVFLGENNQQHVHWYLELIVLLCRVSQKIQKNLPTYPWQKYFINYVGAFINIILVSFSSTLSFTLFHLNFLLDFNRISFIIIQLLCRRSSFLSAFLSPFSFLSYFATSPSKSNFLKSSATLHS